MNWQKTAKQALKSKLGARLNTNVARNVILFLGDGMGVATVTAGRIYAAQKQGSQYGEESSLAFELFRHVGLSKVGLLIPFESRVIGLHWWQWQYVDSPYNR